MLNGIISKLYALSIIPLGLLSIFKFKNAGEQVALFSAYLAGSDVLFRMSGGLFLYEMHKYLIVFFVLFGLIIEQKRSYFSPLFLIYILLLLIGVVFTEVPFSESIRKNVLFNLSGPISLGFVAIYFYKRKITLNKLLDILFCLGLPVVSMISFLYFKTPNIEEIRFGGTASFAASGGYGPNQVSTMLGVGAFVIVAHLLTKKKFSGFFIFDIFLLTYILYRNLLTFSRGGFVTAIFSIVILGSFLIYARKDSVKIFVKFLGFGLVFLIILFIYTMNATEGMLQNRYTNKNASGVEKADITSGRLEIIDTELIGLFENPIFGLGVGSSKYRRYEETGIYAASHNEVTRMIGEHGMIGIIILMLLFFTPITNALKQPIYAWGYLGAFFTLWFLTINHSAMRVSFPGFIYGLSLIQITLQQKKLEH
ncbi:O-antigen ligase family protein [Urechidicola sp. KH5]